jgi:cold shock CspA family protein
VTSFDDAKGWGFVRADRDDGEGEEFFFHCTAVADGTRTIAEGAAVDFDLAAGHRGRHEARNLRPTA